MFIHIFVLFPYDVFFEVTSTKLFNTSGRYRAASQVELQFSRTLPPYAVDTKITSLNMFGPNLATLEAEKYRIFSIFSQIFKHFPVNFGIKIIVIKFSCGTTIKAMFLVLKWSLTFILVHECSSLVYRLKSRFISGACQILIKASSNRDKNDHILG